MRTKLVTKRVGSKIRRMFKGYTVIGITATDDVIFGESPTHCGHLLQANELYAFTFPTTTLYVSSKSGWARVTAEVMTRN